MEAFLAAEESGDRSRVIDELAGTVSAVAPLDRFLTLLIAGNRPLVWEPRLTSLCPPRVASARQPREPATPDPEDEQLLRVVAVTMDPQRLQPARILRLMDSYSRTHEKLACLIEELRRRPELKAWAFPFRTDRSGKGVLLLLTESALTPRRRQDWLLVARAFGVALRKERRSDRSHSSRERLLHDELPQVQIEQDRGGRFGPPTPSLTSREIDVVQGVLKGRSSKELAVALGISEGTVRYHRQRLRKKLGVTGSQESLRHALLRLQDDSHKRTYSEHEKEDLN